MVVSNETFTWATLFYLVLVVFPGALIVSLVQGLHRPGVSGPGRVARGLALPLLVGLALAGAYYLYWCGSDQSCWLNYIRGGDCCEVPRTALSILGAYIIMGIVNHLLAPRIRRWVILVGPILMVMSFLGFASVLSSMPGLWQRLVAP